MRLKRKIPSFVFGVSIGLVIGLGFFVFKINDLFNKLKDSAREQITVIQQPVKNVPVESEDTKKKRDRFKIDLGKSKKINYSEVDSLIRSDAEITIATDELLTVKNVKIIQGDSGDIIGELIREIKQPALFWLDGHYSAGDTAKGEKSTPVLKELKHILSAKDLRHVILVDDARAFGKAEDYPSLEELQDFVISLRKNVEIINKDDIIRILPK